MHRRYFTRRDTALPFLVLALVLVLTCTIGPGAASAQTGQPFLPQQNWYSDTFGLGVIPTAALDSLQVETDGDEGISSADHRHPLPVEADQGLTSARNYRLSPSRRHLYVSGTAVDGSGARMYLYRVPATDGAPLEFLASSISFPDGIDFEGFFDPGVPGEPAFFHGVSRLGMWPTKRIWWVNLNNGRGGYTLEIPTSLTDPVHYAPNGVAAFIEHPGTTIGTSTYKLVSLCDDDLGTALSATGAPFDNLPQPIANAYLVGSAGSYGAEVEHAGTILATIALDDCSGAVSPPTGASCIAGVCVPGLTEQDCIDLGGIWQGAGTTCAGVNCPPPPAPVLTVSITGPTTAPQLQPMTYTATVTNSGNATASSTYLGVYVPFGSDFDSASSPGNYNSGWNRVLWFLGDLAPGSQVTHSITVIPQCGTASLSQSGSFVQSGSETVTGNTLTTAITSNAGTLSATVTATPSRVPLQPGDTIDYAFDFSLSSGSIPGLTFSGLYGDHVDPNGFPDSGGGVWTNNNDVGFTWTGDLDSSAPVRAVLRVVLPACHSEYPPSTTLSMGNTIQIYGACSTQFGAVSPPPATSIAPPDIVTVVDVSGPIEPIGTHYFAPDAVVRPQTPFPVEWMITNVGQQTLQLVDSTCGLGTLLPAAEPPFTGAPPAGASWDAANKRILYTGAVAPGDTVRIHFEAMAPQDACSPNLGATIATDFCPNYTSAGDRLTVVPAPWTEEHLVSLAGPGRFVRYRPGVDAEMQQWFCTFTEYTNTISRTHDGAYWLVGLPTCRLDPATLEMRFPNATAPGGLSLSTLWAVAEDSTGVYLGATIPGGSGDLVSLIAWDLDTDTASVIWQEQTGSVGDLSSIRTMEFDDSGTLGIVTPEGLLLIDPSDPAAAVLHSDPMVTRGYSRATPRPDGNWAACEYVWGTDVEPLVGIDAASGAHSLLVADLNAGGGASTFPYGGLAADDSTRIYLAASYGLLQMVDLGQATPTLTTLTTAQTGCGTLLWISGTPAASPIAVEPPSTARLALHGPVPNPFNPRTTLRFETPVSGLVQLDLFDVRGRRVARLIDRILPAGPHQVDWNGRSDTGRDLPSGLYLARLRADGQDRTTKLLLTR